MQQPPEFLRIIANERQSDYAAEAMPSGRDLAMRTPGFSGGKTGYSRRRKDFENQFHRLEFRMLFVLNALTEMFRSTDAVSNDLD